MNPHRYVVTYLDDVSRRRQREGNTADNKAESWQVVDLAAVHCILETKTTRRYCCSLMYRYVL